jgi:hypothetical protein
METFHGPDVYKHAYHGDHDGCEDCVRANPFHDGQGQWSTTAPASNTYVNRSSYFVTRTSTRRFFARPASVVFGATGLVSE